MTKVKREVLNHKYYIVARDDKGRILEKTKWGKVTLDDIANVWNINHTFSWTKKRVALKKKVYEITYDSKTFKKATNKANYLITATFNFKDKNGRFHSREVVARSQGFPYPKTKAEAKTQAYQHIYLKIAESIGIKYDENVAKRYVKENNIEIEFKEEIVTYTNI